MVAALQDQETIFRSSFITQDILSHPAWHGEIRGLNADKLLRGASPYTYLLRQGESSTENEIDYYVSFVLPDSTIRHQPFVVTIHPWGWSCENSVGCGPFVYEGINDALYLMMHCSKGEPIALVFQ